MAEPSVSNAAHQEVLQATEETRRTMVPQSVPVKMYEASGALVVVAPLPAVMADDVTIELRGQTLRFFASVRSAPARTYLLDEWEFGGYERELELPEGYGSGLEATLHNGQLAIRVLSGPNRADLRVHPST